jgi:non-canonical (house-cleaning) NTP pyrophosphatase
VIRVLAIVSILTVVTVSAAVRTRPTPRYRLAGPLEQGVALTAQQVNFHIVFVSDFLSTGAVLFARQFAIPATVLNDVDDGTPLADALSRALVNFVQVALDAGRELVRSAAQYVAFQVHFLTDVLREVITVATAIPTAVTAFARRADNADSAR